MHHQLSIHRAKLPHLASLAAVLWLLTPSVSRGQAIFSFEDDLQSWESGAGITLAQSSFGATDGANALLIDNLTSGFKNNIATTPNFGPSTPGLVDAFNAFALAGSVIAQGGVPKLEFDLAWDFSQGTTGYIQLAIFVNSSSVSGQSPNPGGYHNLGTSAFINGNSGFDSWPSLGTASINDGVTMTMTGETSLHVAIPFAPDKEMSISYPSTFYDIGFQSNGSWEGTVDFAIDNILFTGVPIFEEHTLFSWETPDDPGTPGVNEQFEGWASAQTPATQNLSITTTGATDGNSALQLDRTPLQEGFTWGSSFVLNSDIDPAVQDQIDELVSLINGAARIAVDVTYEDQFPISPTYSQLWLAFNDETGAYYQAGSASFDINNASPGTTETLIFDLTDFDDATPDSTKNLAVDGLAVGTNSLGIVLGTSTDDGAVYQLDNFRVISEVVSESADFDGDGDVDGQDFLIWQRGFGTGTSLANGDANGDGTVDADDLAIWQGQFSGSSHAATVATIPEPSTMTLAFVVGGVFVARRRKS